MFGFGPAADMPYASVPWVNPATPAAVVGPESWEPENPALKPEKVVLLPL